MKQRIRLGVIVLCGLMLSLWGSGLGAAVEPWMAQSSPVAPATLVTQQSLAQAPAEGEEPPATTPGSSESDGPGSLKPFDQTTEDLVPTPGLFTIYRDPERSKALLGLQPTQLNQNLLLIATLESGLGEAGLFRGWPINDLIIQFRQAPDNKLQVVVPNIYFRNPQSRPQDRQLLQESFSDSILFAVPILSVHPETGEMLIDLGDFLLSRDPANVTEAFSWVLGSYSLNSDTSYLGETKAFPGNVELEAVLGFSGGGGNSLFSLFSAQLDSVPDSRGFGLRVRYSLSSLPSHPGFQPRPADERVGYFISAYRAPAPRLGGDPFVRYINRWPLEKQDPTAALSPPRQPIVFWIENAVPQEYRAAIREGIELWNDAFERAGFSQALEVRQMPPDADWDPADVRYNVIRWSDSYAPWALGLGPSRVNPLTGEILDADVVLDASVIGYLTQQYQTFGTLNSESATALLQLCGHPLEDRLLARLTGTADAAERVGWPGQERQRSPLANQIDYCAGFKASQQMAFGALALRTLGQPFETEAAQTTYINQYLRALTSHEIGHVLGLRHNFLGSTLLSPEAINDPAITQAEGMLSSIMDYFPPNLAPPGQPQGDYFPTRLGPYDLWAIEYGYRPTTNRVTAAAELQDIANRSGGPELAYAADEDIVDFLDPKANAWDLSNDPLRYAQGQMANAQAIWQQLNWFSLNPGENYGHLRQRVDLVFEYYLHQVMTISNYIGGQRFNRTDPWSSRGRPPFEPIAAEEQRQALATLGQEVFAAEALDFSPELLSLLAPDRWWHWGQALTVYPLDYPIYNRILFVQAMALSDVLYGERLVRLRDNELKSNLENPLTLAELFETLTQSLWTEVLEPEPEPQAISSLRRGLQRHYLNILTSLFLRNYGAGAEATDLLDYLAIETTYGAPEDARLLARYQLKQLQGAVAGYSRRHGNQLDVTTLAYLEDVGDRITKVLDAPLEGR